MAFSNTDNGKWSDPTNKHKVDEMEDVEVGDRLRQESIKHGDRALAIIGDGRVQLTEEDVRSIPTLSHHSMQRLFVLTGVVNRTSASAGRLIKLSLPSLSGFTSSR
jgi:hypothetical protein